MWVDLLFETMADGPWHVPLATNSFDKGPSNKTMRSLNVSCRSYTLTLLSAPMNFQMKCLQKNQRFPKKNATQSFRCALSSSIRSKRQSANFHFLRNITNNIHQSGPILWTAIFHVLNCWVGLTSILKTMNRFRHFCPSFFGIFQASSCRHKQSTQHYNEQWEVSPETAKNFFPGTNFAGLKVLKWVNPHAVQQWVYPWKMVRLEGYISFSCWEV